MGGGREDQSLPTESKGGEGLNYRKLAANQPQCGGIN